MFAQVIKKRDLKVLQACPEEISRHFYLGGGTALALHIGHRYSQDFDFFSSEEFNNEWLKQALSTVGILKVFQDKKGTLEGMLRNSRFSFFYYPYPLLRPLVQFENIKLASVTDTALMKLSALSSRGSKKDFIDLYSLRDSLVWKSLMRNFEKKYRGTGYNLYHILKSLAYFVDAEAEPMPRMIIPCQWPQVQDYFFHVQQQLIDHYWQQSS